MAEEAGCSNSCAPCLPPQFPTEIQLMICHMMDKKTLYAYSETSSKGRIQAHEVLQHRMKTIWKDIVQCGSTMFEGQSLTPFRNQQDVEVFETNHRAFSRRVRNFNWCYFPSNGVLIDFQHQYNTDKAFHKFFQPLLWTLRQFRPNITTLAVNLGKDQIHSGRNLAYVVKLARELDHLKHLSIIQDTFFIGHSASSSLDKLREWCQQNPNQGPSLHTLTFGGWKPIGRYNADMLILPHLYFVTQCPNMVQNLRRLSLNWQDRPTVFGLDVSVRLSDPYRENPPQFPELDRLTITHPTPFIFGLFNGSPLQRVTWGFGACAIGVVQNLEQLLPMMDMHNETLQSLIIDIHPEVVAKLSVEGKAAFEIRELQRIQFPAMRHLTIRATTIVLFEDFVARVAAKFPTLQRVRIIKDEFLLRPDTRNPELTAAAALQSVWRKTNPTIQWVTFMTETAKETEHFSRPGIPAERLVQRPVLPA